MWKRRRQAKLLAAAGLVFLIWYIIFSAARSLPPSETSLPLYQPNFPVYQSRPAGITSGKHPKPKKSESILDLQCLSEDGLDRGSGECLVAQYCNSPFKPITGVEGVIPRGYKLRQVHVFIRHGDRTPGHSVPGYRGAKFNCNFSSWYTGNDEKIKKFAARMDAMAGQRSSFNDEPLFPNKAWCDNSVLTSRGALQHIKLGKRLQNSYIDKRELLDRNNPYGAQLFIKCTKFSRTYESAVSFLYGFLPELNISRVNIWPMKGTGFCSEKSMKIASCFCERLSRLSRMIRERVPQSTTGEAYRLQLVISRIFEQPVKMIPHITGIGDALAPTFCHDLPLPCRHDSKSPSENANCVTLSLMGEIWKEIINELKSNNDSTYIEAATLKLYPVLHEIATHMNNLRSSTFAPRFVLYSGHDVTLTPLLLLFGLHDGKWPPYASRFIFETLHHETTNEYYLRLVYNGKDVTREVTFCKSDIQDGVCPLEAFQKFVLEEMLQRFAYKGFTDACKLK